MRKLFNEVWAKHDLQTLMVGLGKLGYTECVKGDISYELSLNRESDNRIPIAQHISKLSKFDMKKFNVLKTPYLCTYVLYVCTYVHACIHTYVHTYIHACIHTSINA